MSTPFLSEIKIVSFNFPPKGWTLCNGQLLPINQNQALFSLLGTTYGGNGQTNFALPNLQGNIPVHEGNGFTLGERGGETSHTLNITELPSHNHVPVGSTASPTVGPANALWAKGNASVFTQPPNNAMNPQCIVPIGGNQPHENMSPYLVLNFIIALQGIFPSQN